MNIKRALKRSESITGMVRDLRKIFGVSVRRRSRRLVSDYLASHSMRKLQIGSGPSALEGWLNTDLAPERQHVAKLDATRRFPFAENTFDYVYSEHMIEHVTWREGLFTLRECRRVLKPGGRIRVATPDLEVLVGLYSGNPSGVGEKYIEWITDNFVRGVSSYRAAFVLNNAFHNFGHRFLYDGELLQSAMQEAGFENVQRRSYGESDDEHLRGVERHGTNQASKEMVVFETMVFEGTCPG